MINKSKLGLLAAVVLVSVGSAAFAQTTATAPARHHYAHRPLYDYAGANVRLAPGGEISPGNPVQNSVKPVDQPALTGGGSAGYNACAGHPRC